MVSRGGAGAASQRRRWEEGRKSLRGKFVGLLLRSRHLDVLRKSCYLLDLYYPPLASLGLGLGCVGLIHPVALAIPDLGSIAGRLAAFHLGMLGVLAGYAISPVIAMNLPIRFLMSLIAVPYYVGWKIIVALGNKQKGWIRTPRESRPPA